MIISRIISGGLAVVLGIVFVALFLLSMDWAYLIYGVIVLGFGVAIFLNSKEDVIEKIRRRKV